MSNLSRKLQIAVIGSSADLNYSEKLAGTAKEIGKLIAKNGAALIFGAEKDYDSLPTIACRGAKEEGGLTIGFTYGKGLDVFERDNIDIVVATGLERGGGRELPFILSADTVIAISGGSGTLTEMGIAYQAGIPIVALKGYGGWADKLAGQFMDKRNRLKVIETDTPEAAVEQAINLAKSKRE